MTLSGGTIGDLTVWGPDSPDEVQNGCASHNGDCALLAEQTGISYSNRETGEAFEGTTEQYRSLLERRATAHWEE